MSAVSAAITVPRRFFARPALPYIIAFAAAALGAGLGRAITTTYLCPSCSATSVMPRA